MVSIVHLRLWLLGVWRLDFALPPRMAGLGRCNVYVNFLLFLLDTSHERGSVT